MKEQKRLWDLEYKNNENKWNRETRSIPAVLKGKKVLELGVGNGKTLRAILKLKPERVVAVDFSEEAIKICKDGFDGVKFVNGDVKKLPFADSSFDIVVCYYILDNLLEKDRKKAVKEIYRVLNKEGKVLFEDFAVGDFRDMGRKIEKNTREKKNGLICHFFDVPELKKLFGGFSRVDVKKKEFSPFSKSCGIKRKIVSGIVIK